MCVAFAAAGRILAVADQHSALRGALIRAVDETRSPGAVACVGNADGAHFLDAYGYRSIVPAKERATTNTVYDLASLTKVIATTTAVLLLRDEGKLALDDPAGTHVPIPAFNAFTVRQLLTHTAGLHPGKPLYREVSSIDEMLMQYAATPLSWPPGSRRRYSDVGFMILGRLVELVAGDSLAAFCQARVFDPLGMKDTAFNPPKDWAVRCAATEKCAWRKRVMQGEVHDENAYAVGGASGHAGLFSTAEDLARFCRGLLSGALLGAATMEEMTRLGQTPVWPWQGLGWQIDPWSSGETGFLPARSVFGHSGWTGTALWMDRVTGLYAILLGNTCHPSRADRNNDLFRHTFYTEVAKQFYPDTRNVHSGLDRLVREGFDGVRDQRVAVLTHHAAVDQLGRHILDVLKLAPDVHLEKIFSPEHGLTGAAEAGAKVGSDTRSAVPVISLYGDRKEPSRADLAGVDVFVIDLQDVGARYYTYAATMKRCLTACAAAKVPVLVLDRPNPVGGEALEGPIAARADSDVCWGAAPARHGMTMGEIALWFQATELRDAGLRLSVSTLDNWERRLLFDACSLPWIPPSPNIPDPETALVYVGTCLFEGTNLSEGRGTETPFKVFGAPWLDAEAVTKAITEEERAGLRLECVRFTPRSIPGKAASPRYKDQECVGIRIYVENARAARPFTLALALLSAARAHHRRDFEWTSHFDVLMGGPELRERIEAGVPAAALAASFEPALAAFAEKRPKRYD